MIVVRVELHSAINGSVTELARMHISNTGGGTAQLGHYAGETFVGRDKAALDRGRTSKHGFVASYPRRSLHVWNLVHRMLGNMGYVK